MMLKVEMDTEAGNAAIQSGKIGEIIVAAVERLKPEGAYFTPSEHGKRCDVLL